MKIHSLYESSAEPDSGCRETLDAGGTCSNVGLQQKLPTVVCYNNGFLVDSTFYPFSVPRHKEIWEAVKEGVVEPEIAPFFKGLSGDVSISVRVIPTAFAPSQLGEAQRAAAPPCPSRADAGSALSASTSNPRYDLAQLRARQYSGSASPVVFMLDLLGGQRVKMSVPCDCLLSELFEALRDAGVPSGAQLLVGFPPRKLSDAAVPLSSLSLQNELVRLILPA